MSPDGLKLATYDFGDPDAPVVVAVHGFASGAVLNWHASGWTRDLVRAGYRVVALDQRGHGASSKPHDPAAYSMDLLVADVTTVVDTYLLDDVAFLGYSLGARVGWHTASGSRTGSHGPCSAGSPTRIRCAAWPSTRRRRTSPTAHRSRTG